jgi:iron complex outermembrane recepter protein
VTADSLRSQSIVRASVAAILGTAALYGPMSAALAQEAQPPARDEEVLEEVQITGSRILRKDLDSSSPLVTISAEVLENRANLAIESALNELPQFIPALTGFSDINRQQQLGAASSQFNTSQITFSAGNTVGATNVSLRGLGANRNLVLLNGKRLVPVNASMGVDTSSVPSSALQRVEIVTGGASSAYGADAVSGVINFILKENFTGVDLDAQYGATELGDNENLRISGLLGGNFADARGNAMLGFEFSDRSEALQIERDFYRRQLSNPYAGTGANASLTGFPSGTSPTVLPPFVTYGNLPSQAVIDQIFSQSAPGSVPRNSTFLLNPDGTVFISDAPGAYRFNGGLDGLHYKINQQNGDWIENNLLTRVSSPLRRYSMFGSGHFDATDSLTFYAQSIFSQSKTESVLDSGMAFSNWGILIPHGSGRNCATVGVTSGGCQNTDPLPANLAAFGTWANVPTLAQYRAGGAAGLPCGNTGGCTNSQAFPVPTELGRLLDSRQNQINIPGMAPIVIPGPNEDFALDVPMSIFGEARGTKNESTNFQIITGVRGDLHLSDWTYDLYTSFGTSRTTQEATGAASYGRLRALARMPNYGKGAVLEGNIAPPGTANQNHPTTRCTSGLPIFPSLFTGAISQDCVDTVVVDPVTTTRMDQTVVEASFQGGLFDLPAGGLRFAAGAGWRKNTFQFIPAEILSQESVLDGVVGFNPISGNDNSDQVKEGFAELLVPVLRDLPFVTHLNLELGYRYSDYRFGGTVQTWKALGDWALTPDLRIRGGYQKANRAPNLVELFQKDSDQFLFGPGDPCALNSGLSWSVNPTANGNTPEKAAQVRQVCEALMGASGAAAFYANPNGANHTNFFNGLGFSFEFARVSGNPDLKSESSDTVTLGAVLRSPFKNPLAQFSVSVDYFKIEVADAIGIVQLNSLYGGIYRHCYDPAFNTALDPNDSFCQQVPRDTNTGAKLANPRITYSNVGGIVSEGIDLSFNWSAALSDMGVSFIPGRVSYGLNGNYLMEDGRQAAPGEPFEEFTGLSGFGSFKWTVFNTFGWFNGPANATLRWRHYPGTEAYSHFAGIDEKVQGISSYSIFDMSLGYSLGRGLQLRAGVDNLLDKAPPIADFNPGVGGPGTEDYSPGTVAGGAYDTLGRSYYLGVRMSF